MNIKKILIALGIILAVIIVFVAYKKSKPWMLSIYGNGDKTIMRLDYPSKDFCLSAGRSYIADKIAERFDCSYKCTSFDRSDLQISPICKTVCNDVGCR